MPHPKSGISDGISVDLRREEEKMASWVTHLMVADGVLDRVSGLDRHGFCVGNMAQDCNVENEDWTEFTPPRAVTHIMAN